jgi:predicted DNA-binding protein with PD1-like motif
MRFQGLGERYQLRFESGEAVADKLMAWLAKQRIGYASMTGLGAVKSARISYWNSATGEYEPHDLTEQMEVVSLVGNATIKEGAPFTHIHVALGKRDLSVVGGHFNDAIVHPNLEVWLRPEAASVERTLDEACGLYLMDLPERA